MLETNLQGIKWVKGILTPSRIKKYKDDRGTWEMVVDVILLVLLVHKVGKIASVTFFKSNGDSGEQGVRH